MEKGKFDKIKYNNEYNAKAYDRITHMAPKGHKDMIKAAADAAGLSMRRRIRSARAEGCNN